MRVAANILRLPGWLILALIPFALAAETDVHGEIGGGAPMPAGTIQFFAAACPAGWSEYAALRGRYVVGMPSGGTMSGGRGTTLTNNENRPVGRHQHGFSATDGAHTHPWSPIAPTHGHGYNAPENNDNMQSGGGVGSRAGIAGTTDSTDANVSLNTADLLTNSSNSGSVAGTNAPYVQLRPCRKD